MQNQVQTGSALPSAPEGTAQAANLSVSQVTSTGAYRGGELAAELLTRLFHRLPIGLTLRLWNGTSLRVGAQGADVLETRFALLFRNPELVCTLILGRDPLRLAEAYFPRRFGH